MGKPVVSTPADGVVEIVIPEETGFLIPYGDDAELARCALTLLSHPELGSRLGHRARELVIRRFDLEAMVHRTESLYNVLLREKELA